MTALRCALTLLISLAMITPSGGVICGSISVRNNASNLHALQDCTVVEGFVKIVLIQLAEEKDFEPFKFTQLREVTQYVMLYSITGLRSLASLFPNLERIGGESLFMNFALIIHQLFSLQEVGLISLREISRGSVIITRNPRLCFVDTVDWSQIAQWDKAQNYKAKNGRPEDCPSCPQHCPEGLCWTANHCQQVTDGPSKGCHERCVGACRGPSARDCYTCRGLLGPYGECVDHCPPNTYKYLNRRCVHKRECIATKWYDEDSFDEEKPYSERSKAYVIFKDECKESCPPGFEVSPTILECVPCPGGKCDIWCSAASISSAEDAQKMRLCTHIKGSLEIGINTGNSRTFHNELEKNLGSIIEITGYLKVTRSSLINLNFLRNLSVIGGTHGKESEQIQYALYVDDNPNLQELWDWNRKKNFTILNNKKPFFHNNPKLCLQNIYKLLEVVRYEKNVSDLDIDKITNGYKSPCNATQITIEVSKISSDTIVILVPYLVNEPADQTNEMNTTYNVKTMAGGRQEPDIRYVLYYTKDPDRRVDMFYDLDQCSDYGWRTEDITVDRSGANITARGVYVNITDLEPNTQYAFYIMSYARSPSINNFGGKSGIKYETTLPGTPSELNKLQGFSNCSSEITLKWEPPRKVNGKLEHYIVMWSPLKEDKAIRDLRDYCKNPMDYRITTEKKTAETTEKGVGSKGCCSKRKPTRPLKEEFENICSDLSKTSSIFSDILDSPTFESHFYKNIYRTDTLYGLYNETNLQDKYILPANSTGTTTKGLNHFQTYVVMVKACREKHPNESKEIGEERRCSKPQIIILRTKKEKSADSINQIRYDVTDNTLDIFWDPPKNPNGLLLAFEIEYQHRDIDNTNKIIECITYDQYKTHKEKGYSKYFIQNGKYEFRIRSVTLADKGAFTDFFTFDIDNSTFSSLELCVLVLVAVIVFLMVFLSSYLLGMKKDKNISLMLVKVNPNYDYIPDHYEVDRKRVEFGEELGCGSFGSVYDGVLKPDNIRCAIKVIKDDASEECRHAFLSEATVMKSMADAHHIVQLLGVVSVGSPPMVLMELMELGDLKSYLRSIRDTCLTNGTIIQMASEIADAMCFLEAKKFVHRDLAARNCMISGDLTVKVGDFGMTRDIYETDYYQKKGKGLLPIRWMAPESLQYGEFTSKSDVWSYGVVLWEIVSMAEQPYQGLSNNDVLKEVVAGRRLEVPKHCPLPLKSVTISCWTCNPTQRLTFARIMGSLNYYHDAEFRRLAYHYSQEAVALRQDAWEYVEMKSPQENHVERQSPQDPLLDSAPRTPSPHHFFDSLLASEKETCL